MDNIRLSSTISKIQDRLSNDDRDRLHFYLDNDGSQRLRDDPSFTDTFNRIDFLFDQDKISEEDSNYLINAFESIHCVDAANRLREHLNQHAGNQLTQSLSLIMPPTLNQVLVDQKQNDDKQPLTLNNIGDDNNLTINNRRRSSSGSRRKQLFGKRLFVFILLSFFIHILVILFCFWNNMGIRDLRKQYVELIEMTRQNHMQTVQSIQKFEHTIARMERITKKRSKQQWKSDAITVAGGNGKGNQSYQFDRPEAIFFDGNQTIYIADTWNNRIVQWKRGDKKGEVIVGVNGEGNRINQLKHPTAVIIDKRNNALIIADRGNRRVVRWSMQKRIEPEILISNIDCRGLAMDKDGLIYVSDYIRHEVRRWKIGEQQGQTVAGGHGRGDGLNQFVTPVYIFVDDDYSVYVSDKHNYRVMKWMKGAKEGIIVAGGHGQGENLAQLSDPEGVVVDRWGQIYVADYNNHRVMRWNEGNKEGEIVVGGNGWGKKSNQLNGPIGLSFDAEENLYVVEYFNHRVQKFEKDGD